MTPEQLAQIAQTLGVVGLLAFAILGGYRGLYVFGPTHKAAIAEKDSQLSECKADRDEWKGIALAGISTAEKATTLATKAGR